MRRRALTAAALAAAATSALVAGCYSPSFDNPTCPTGECPSGFTCVNGTCVSGNGQIDAPAIDAPDENGDAMVDAMEIDAPPGTITHTANIAVIETQLFSPSGSPFGQGVTINTTFLPTAGNMPVVDTNPGSPFGCKVYEQTTAAAIAAVGGVNEGSVAVTVSNPGTPPSPANPIFPPCLFISSLPGYSCIDAGNTGSFTSVNNGSLQMVQTSVYSLTMPQQTFGQEDVGRQMLFNGTGFPSLDGGAFVIVSFVNAQTVALAIPSATAGTITTGTYTTIAGAAVTPQLPDPGQMADGAGVTVTVDGTTTGSGNHVGSFNANIANVGDDFGMDGPNFMRLLNVPTDGTSFTLGCAPCNGGATTVSILTLITTDASVTGTTFFAMPRAQNKRVQITCSEIGTGMVTVPLEVAARLDQSDATRVQAAFIRAEVALPTTAAGSSAVVVAGHSMVGYTTP